MDVCDGACAVCGIQEALRVDALGLCVWRGGCDDGAGMEYSCCVDPPDELICRNHIRTFPLMGSVDVGEGSSVIGDLMLLKVHNGQIG